MRQLSLFKGKRQRGVAPPPAPEFSSHVIIADLCRRWLNPGWRYTHIPSGEHREHRINPRTGRRYSLTGQRLQRMGLVAGWPDFIFAGPNAVAAFLELKRPKRGRLSEDQLDIGEHLAACGFPYLCTNSVDEATVWLKAHGILRSNIEVQ